MRTWIIAALMFLDAGCISNFYWLGATLDEGFYIPAIVLSMITLAVGVGITVEVLDPQKGGIR